MKTPEGDITVLIRRAREGDAGARELVITKLYPRLRRLAARKRASHGTVTLLDTYGLLHEALEKMLGTDLLMIQNSRHLMAYAAHTMRSVMVDHVRRSHAHKREGGERVTLHTGDELLPVADRSIDLISLDEALHRLESADPRLASIVELRCFAGLTMEEIAAELDLSLRTANREWQKARAFLKMVLDPAA
jgi:RNA polymerase sigma-70 factor, ECF subfamily